MLRPNQPARRVCLTCGQSFDSEGPWNRRCQDCDNDVAYRYCPPTRSCGANGTGLKSRDNDFARNR